MMDGEPHYGHRLLTGILLGDRFNLPRDALDAFGESGTGHLLAVSGLHIGAAALSTFWIFNLLALRMRLRFPHRIGILGALVAVATMLMVSNAPLSAQRASLMITGYLMGRFVGLRIPILRCLYWAAIYLLWNDPGALSSPAFQFSFIAVFSLIRFAGGGSGPVSWLRVAFVAAVSTAPIQVWHFGTFAPTGLVANVILTPFTALVVVPLGLFGVICAPVSQLPLECAAISAQGMVCVAESLVEVFGGSLILGRWMTPIATALALSLFLASRPKQLLLSWFSSYWLVQ